MPRSSSLPRGDCSPPTAADCEHGHGADRDHAQHVSSTVAGGGADGDGGTVSGAGPPVGTAAAVASTALSAGSVVFVWNASSLIMLLLAPCLHGAAGVNVATTAIFAAAAVGVGWLV